MKKSDKEIIEYLEKQFIAIDSVGIKAGINDFFIGHSITTNYKEIKTALYRYDRVTDKIIKITKDFDNVYHYGLIFNESNYIIVSNYTNLRKREKNYILYEYNDKTDKCKKIISAPFYGDIISYIKTMSI